MLLLLLACADCPDFEDMTVFDPGETAKGYVEYRARWAIEDFAAWTGRPGVCVPRVELSDTISYGFDGLYQGPRNPILVRAGLEDPYSVVLHELAHGLDHIEDHVADHPELFPPAGVHPVDYPGEIDRRKETFAITVSAGVTNLDLRSLLVDECGLDLEWTDAEAYVQSEVYSEDEPWPVGAPRAEIRRWTPAPIEGMPPAPAIYDGIAWEGELLVLAAGKGMVRQPGWEPGPLGGEGTGTIFRIDPHEARVTGRIDVDLGDLHVGVPAAYFAMTDEGPVVVVSGEDNRFFDVDFDRGQLVRREGIPLPPFTRTELAISEGTAYYAATWEERPTLEAVDLATGTMVDLGLDQERWGKTVYVEGIWPVDGGVRMVSQQEGITRRDAHTGEWAMEPFPKWWGLDLPVPLDGERILFFVSLSTRDGTHATLPVLHDPETGGWHFAQDLCGALATDHYVYHPALIDGAVWYLAFEHGETRPLLGRFEVGPTP